MLAYLVAAALVLHGLVHALGFVAIWFADRSIGISRVPTVFGRLDLDQTLVHAAGVAWLAVALAFGATALGLVVDATWWRVLAVTAALASLALCALWWNEAKIGAAIDLLVLIALLASARVAPAGAT